MYEPKPCEICGLNEGQDHSPCIEVKQLRELIVIRDRKIELQAQEIAMLKKLLALQKPAKEVEPVWLTGGIPLDRADLETDEYP